MNKDYSELYLAWIAQNYKEIKKGIDRQSQKDWSKPIDEDIFHDTIIKCVDKLKDKDVSLTQLKNYLFISYKTNYIREFEYARNKYNESINELYDIEYNEYSNYDYNIIKEKIIRNFGQKEWELFQDYIYGAKISEIEKESREKGLYYRFNKIKEFVKDYLD